MDQEQHSDRDLGQNEDRVPAQSGKQRSPEAMQDHALVRRAQAGDQAAFGELVERHEERATRVAWGLVANREDARDLAQEAFLRVFKSLDRFDFRHDFTTWLYRIVTNLAIDHLRKKRPSLSTGQGAEDAPPLDLADEGAPSPAAGMESAETVQQVRACIDALPEHFRSVLMLRELEGLPCQKIADVVGATQVTVRWRLHRGRKLFQDEWERRERGKHTAQENPSQLSSKASKANKEGGAISHPGRISP